MDNEKKYNELVGKIKRAYLYAQTGSTKAVLEDILPELRESEDEKIRKVIYGWIYTRPSQFFDDGFSKEEMLAWLEKQQKPIINVPPREVIISIWDLGNEWKELTNGSISTEHGTQLDYIQKHWHESEYYLQKKQGEQKSAEWHKGDEQNLNACLGYIPDEYLRRWLMDVIHVKYDKPTDKVEPKFKVRDWVVIKANGNEHIKQIVRIEYFTSGHPQYILSDGLWFGNGTEARLWTIQDAKDGDVLVASDGSIFLFGGVDDSACKYYAALTADNYIKINKEAKGGYWETSRAVYPATKKQRDKLMKAMTDAGYTFDFDKKELNKIEQTPTWSEEDEHRAKDTIYFLDTAKKHYASTVERDACIDWLKSLKNKVAPQKQWKPSDEQMKALDWTLSFANNCGEECLSDLRTLHEQLKKLRDK